MKPLARIGYYGEKALIGVEYSLGQEAKISILPTRFIKGRLVPGEPKEVAGFDQLFTCLDQFPGMGIYLWVKKLETLDSFLIPGEGNIPGRVMGVAVEKPEDFAYQKIAAQEGEFVSLIRKSFLQDAMSRMGKYQDRIIGLNISALPLVLFIPALQGYKPEIAYSLELENSSYFWQGGLRAKADDAQKVYPHQLAQALGLAQPFASLFAAMSLFYAEGISSFSGADHITDQKKALKKNQTLAKGLSLGIITILSLILLAVISYGFLSLSSYSGQEQIKANRALLTKIKSQERKLTEKNSFLIKAGQKSLRPTKISYYLDQICSHAGNKIGFDKLSYKPKEPALKKISLELLTKKPDILLEGYSGQSGSLADFTAELQALEFVRAVEVFESSFSFEENLQRFRVLITLTNE